MVVAAESDLSVEGTGVRLAGWLAEGLSVRDRTDRMRGQRGIGATIF